MLSNHQLTIGIAPLGFSLCATAIPTPKTAPLKTRQQVRDEFAKNGWSYTGWARQNGYPSNLIISIVNDDDTTPRYKCLRGEAHNAAVQLGLKAGEISRPAQRAAMQLPA